MPVTASVVGNFAIVTILTKNTFLDEIGRQYVLTARAKGARTRRAVEARAAQCRDPAAHGAAGRVRRRLPERQPADRDAVLARRLGLLSYDSVIRRDYPVVLGSLFLFTLIGLLTKLIADICYVLVDPRIQFSRLDH
jgi:microcin C transport system permease protein